MLFYQKQHVIRSISRDIFQIKSDEISFSSEKIFISSEKIFISSEKTGKKSEKIGKSSRKSGKVREFVQDSLYEWFWTHVENILFFLVYLKFWPKSALRFNTQICVFG